MAGKQVVITGIGTCYYTNDIFVASPVWVDVSTGLPAFECFNLKVDPFDRNRYYVISDGELYVNPDLFGSGTWTLLLSKAMLTATYGAITFHNVASVDTVLSSAGMLVCSINRRGPDIDTGQPVCHCAIWHSHDYGVTWSILETGSHWYASPVTPMWTGMAVGQHNPVYIYQIFLFSSSDTRIYVSKDGGHTIDHVLPTGTITYGGLLKIPYSANDDNICYDFLLDKSGPLTLYRTRKTLDSWNTSSVICSTTIPYGEGCSAAPLYSYQPVKFDPNDATKLYSVNSELGIDYGVSVDGGVSWSLIPLGIAGSKSITHDIIAIPGGTQFYVVGFKDVTGTADDYHIHISSDLSTWFVADAPVPIMDILGILEPTIVPPIYNPLPVRCQATYWANLYDFNGNLVAAFDDFKPLTIEHRINGYSNCTFSIDGLDSRISLFKLDYILEVWRDIGDIKYIEFEGVHRSDQLQYTEGGHWIYTSYSRSFEDFLMRRCVLYRNLAKVLESDGVTWHGYTLKNIAADDAMKEFVNENLGPGANNHVVGDANTRLVNGTMPNFNIEANTSQGPMYFANFSYLNLYEVLQKIAEATGVDFKIRRYSGNQFEFYTRYPMLGSDKSATLIFSPEYGNMTVPSWTLTRTEEVNVVAVLGQGENTYRHALTFERASTMDSPWNRRETTHDSSNDTGQGFIDTGTEVLNNLKAKEEFTFQVMQTDASAYGYDYVLGDVATVKFGAITKLKKITGVVINVSDGKEDIKISFSDYPTIPPI